MNTLILNRDFKLPDDGWYPVEKLGEYFNAAAKVVQIIDQPALAAIVNRFADEKAAAGDDFAGLLIDFDHFSLDTSQSSEAAGWVMDLRNRSPHLEAQIRWTSAGEPRVKGGDYRFFSTVYPTADTEPAGERIVNRKAYKAVRPLRLERLALTNDPNNRAGARPISNRQTAATAERDETTPSTMKNVLKKLGLADDASEESAVAAVTTIQNRASSAETERDALKTERDALKTERDTLLGAVVEADLDKFAPVIANRDAMKKQLLANRAGTLAILESLKKPSDGQTVRQSDRERITNRGQATPPSSSATETEEEKKQRAEEARAARIANRARAIQQAAPGTPLAAAYTAASAEVMAEEAKS